MSTEATIRRMLVSDLFVDLPEDRIDSGDSLRDVVGLDSLGFMELRVQCEDTFGIQICDEDFSPEHFSSVRAVATLVDRLREPDETMKS